MSLAEPPRKSAAGGVRPETRNQGGYAAASGPSTRARRRSRLPLRFGRACPSNAPQQIRVSWKGPTRRPAPPALPAAGSGLWKQPATGRQRSLRHPGGSFRGKVKTSASGNDRCCLLSSVTAAACAMAHVTYSP